MEQTPATSRSTASKSSLKAQLPAELIFHILALYLQSIVEKTRPLPERPMRGYGCPCSGHRRTRNILETCTSPEYYRAEIVKIATLFRSCFMHVKRLLDDHMETVRRKWDVLHATCKARGAWRRANREWPVRPTVDVISEEELATDFLDEEFEDIAAVLQTVWDSLSVFTCLEEMLDASGRLDCRPYVATGERAI